MHYVHQAGSNVFKYAVRRMAEVACHLLERKTVYSSRDLALVVPHQANCGSFAPCRAAWCGRLQGPGEYRPLREHDQRHRPTRSTGRGWRKGRLHKGDLVLLVAVGRAIPLAGYSCVGPTDVPKGPPGALRLGCNRYSWPPPAKQDRRVQGKITLFKL